MARATRSKPAPADAKDDKPKSSTSKITLESQIGNSQHVFILPKKSTADARIVTLPHPRHGTPSRYLVCPKSGIYDVSSSADLYLATATDPLFVILPAVCESQAAKGDEKKRLFLSSDDYFDKLPEEFSHLSEILRTPSTRKLFESRLAEVCDTVDAGDESMYRLSEEKLLTAVLKKARRMCDGGLPQSMEDKFVVKALEAPMLLQKSSAAPPIESQATPEAESGVSTPMTESNESQSTTTTTDTAASSVSQPSTAATSFIEAPAETDFTAAITASLEIHNLQRLKVAFDFICSSYLPPTLGAQLLSSLSNISTSKVNFKPLEDYLAQLAKLRAEAVAARSQGDYSRKRARDEEEDEARAEKKRKLEEEKKKKASESHGVRQLKKVNTSGMKKLSAFFQKK
ncbi:hypothetical protein LIA77_09748 [Sarocladium implicatum]|nr:hypothetical protein LIA77_09748 [Sarocladium implicatum]